MSELRYNLIARDWVIIASERAKRPSDFKKAKAAQPVPERKDDCPFCPGNEGSLNDERFRLADGKSWKTRVVYNKFPALSDKVKDERRTTGPHKWISGFGIHEVIIEHPMHNMVIPLMKDGEVEDIIRTYKERCIEIQKDERIKAITIFKNHGPGAGCSLEHPHSQLVATPIVPPYVRSRLESALEYFDITGRCIFCQIMEHELREKRRIIVETGEFVSFIPYAAFFPFLINILPRRHQASFDDTTEEEIRDLARNLKMTLGKLYNGLDNPDFNYTIRSCPVREKWNESFHWYISVIPRLTKAAGFELGSGMFINSSIPEDCADFLRHI